eukprot:5193488-Prymnesium_polylepis.1
MACSQSVALAVLRLCAVLAEASQSTHKQGIVQHIVCTHGATRIVRYSRNGRYNEPERIEHELRECNDAFLERGGALECGLVEPLEWWHTAARATENHGLERKYNGEQHDAIGVQHVTQPAQERERSRGTADDIQAANHVKQLRLERRYVLDGARPAAPAKTGCRSARNLGAHHGVGQRCEHLGYASVAGATIQEAPSSPPAARQKQRLCLACGQNEHLAQVDC